MPRLTMNRTLAVGIHDCGRPMQRGSIRTHQLAVQGKQVAKSRIVTCVGVCSRLIHQTAACTLQLRNFLVRQSRYPCIALFPGLGGVLDVLKDIKLDVV